MTGLPPATATAAAAGAVGPDPAPASGRRPALRLPRQPLLRHLLFFAVGVALFYLVTVSLSTYNNFQIGEIGAYAVALAGLSVLTGQNGQISLGHGALMAVGGYAIALLMGHTHINFVLELVIATLVSAAVGVLVGIPATRLSGPYLAGVTLMLALAVPLVAAQYGSVFGGDQGLTTTAPTGPASVPPERWLAWIQLAAAMVAMVLLANLLRSRFGRAMRAVRDDEVAAAVSGIRVARTKVLAFAVSAGCAGLGGALLVLSTGVVNTGEFPLTLSIELLAAMVLGGAGTLGGAWWGAIGLVYVPQWSTSLSHHLSLGTAAAAYLADALFGALLVLTIMVAPTGIQGSLRRVWDWTWRRATGAGRPPAAIAVDGGSATGGGGTVAVAAARRAPDVQRTEHQQQERSIT